MQVVELGQHFNQVQHPGVMVILVVRNILVVD